MDKISKAVKKLNSKDALKIADTIELLVKGDLKNLNIKRLKGHKDIFRVRVGNYRIIFKKEVKGVTILHIGNRDEKTYKI
ncbi:type II toxin-antitoxin system RelE/ParE family toxin [Candidatus Nomurabacteria bacterium]|nr:type II toxin-antitoxin system RelE/ParE family toxin [Candidatus Nomurabacteria bacterium]